MLFYFAKCDSSAEPTLAVALALHWCLNWILTTNQDGQFLVETDSEVCVKCLQGKIQVASISNVMLDCCDMLSSLSNCKVDFLKRCKNAASRSLVGLAKQNGSNSWVEFVPEPTATVICKDKVHLIWMKYVWNPKKKKWQSYLSDEEETPLDNSGFMRSTNNMKLCWISMTWCRDNQENSDRNRLKKNLLLYLVPKGVYHLLHGHE